MEIVDYPNYLIYPDGRVQNKKSKRFLKLQTSHDGYPYIGLYKDKKQKNYTTHRLVALHYIPNPDNKPEVDHLNRIKNDNRIENLRWVTHSENNQNIGKQKNNKSGHKYISYDKSKKSYRFYKMINGKVYIKVFKSKIDAICYKFIFIIKNKDASSLSNRTP